jgi:hypothetical protein
MKNLLMGSLLLSMPLFAELSVGMIDKMVEQIQGKRESKVKVDFERVVSPFATVERRDLNTTPKIKVVAQQVHFKLSAIINDEAKINSRWVKAGDMIEGYRVESIGENRVVLKKLDQKVELFLPNPKNNKLIQISEG